MRQIDSGSLKFLETRAINARITRTNFMRSRDLVGGNEKT